MNVGDIAPDFNLIDQNGNEFRLYDKLSRSILLVFYPKDRTPVCSAQLRDYNENIQRFGDIGISLAAINADTLESHSTFCSELKLSYPLLSDGDKAVCRQFGAVNLFGQIKRELILVSTSKKIVWIGKKLPVSFIKSSEILAQIQTIKF